MKSLILAIVLLFTTLSFAKPVEKIHKVVVLKQWPPYYTTNKDGKPDGYAIEIFEKVASNINLNYEYIVVDDWSEVFTLFEEKKANIVPNVGITKRRDYIFNFTQPTDIFEIKFFKYKSLKEIKNIDDIKKHKVGVVEKNICTKLVNQHIASNKIVFENYHRALYALNKNEIDILCYPKTSIEHSIQELNLKNIVPFGEALHTVQRGIAVSKDEIHLLDLLDKELLRLKGNGEYQEIYNRWFPSNEQFRLTLNEVIYLLVTLFILIIIVFFYLKQKKWLFTKSQLEEDVRKKTEELNKLKDEQLLQQKLLLTQSKVAAVGEMLGNIAHQWRQPLTIITTNTSSLLVSLDFEEKITDDMIKKCAISVETQAKYLSRTIDDFRNFFKADNELKHTVILKNTLKKTYDLVESSFGHHNINYITNIDDSIILNINENLLIQAFINIFNNSKDAFIENNIDSEDRYFFVDLLKEDDNIKIFLKDSAGGIKQDIIDKIFEPYFTTKSKSVGTGIGLYMTHQIITKHLNGMILAKNSTYKNNNKELKGAVFEITIPV